MENNELKHHGVKGMRWGIRRSPKQLGRSSGGQKKPQPQQQQAPKSSSRPGQSRGRRLTDQEMRDAINHIKLEREYAQLMRPRKSKGRQFVEDVLANAGKQVATTYTAKFMGSGIDKLLNLGSAKKEKSWKEKFKGMSDAELKSKVDRANLENQYRRYYSD